MWNIALFNIFHSRIRWPPMQCLLQPRQAGLGSARQHFDGAIRQVPNVPPEIQGAGLV